MMRHALIWLSGLMVFCCGAVTLSAGATTPSAGAPRLQVNGETVVGAASPTPGIDAYLGVPFALPPIGALRWRAPVDYIGDGGVRQATGFAPACMQSMRILDWYRGMAERFGSSRSVFPDLAVSEDCLYLNVWAPRVHRGRPLPVMVFVHGGSNRSGWSYEPNYHGHRLAAEGAVVVTIAYRLGVFGFFSHPQLAGERGAQANFGLWDQLAALRWVQRNIAAFGGDRDRVTLFGESAGGGDIAALMLSPAARGLMHRAIIQSGGDFGWPGIRTLEAEQARGIEFAAAVDAAQPPDLEALRRIDAARLLEVEERSFADHYHAPVVDGVIITGQLQQRLAAGDWPLQQLLIGTNGDEYYAADRRGTGEEAIDEAVAEARVLKSPVARDALRATPATDDAVGRLQTAERMLCPAQRLAGEVARAGRKVRMYHFTRVREGAVAAEFRAYHGAELPYVFGTHDAWLPTAAADDRLTREMMRAWVRFAATGSPEGPSGVRWPDFRPGSQARVLRLDVVTTPVVPPEPVLCRLYRAAAVR